MESSRGTRDRQFEQWVCERLALWPTLRVLQFEDWLRSSEEYEFLPAVHEALRRRGAAAVTEPAA